MKEVFKKVRKCPMYSVSNLGRVRNNKRNTILKPCDNGFGYLYVCLSPKILNYHVSVHRLVALEFINNPLNLPQVHHIDENKSNNRVDNLKWVTGKENVGASRVTTQKNKTLKNKKLRGACYVKGEKVYLCKMSFFGKLMIVGRFKTKKESYLCFYNTFKEFWGEEPFDKSLIP